MRAAIAGSALPCSTRWQMPSAWASTGNAAVLLDVAHERRRAARDHHVDLALERDHGVDVGAVLEQNDGAGVEALLGQRAAQQVGERGVAARGLAPALEHDRVAGAHREAHQLRHRIGSGLEHRRDHAEWAGHAPQVPARRRDRDRSWPGRADRSGHASCRSPSASPSSLCSSSASRSTSARRELAAIAGGLGLLQVGRVGAQQLRTQIGPLDRVGHREQHRAALGSARRVRASTRHVSPRAPQLRARPGSSARI